MELLRYVLQDIWHFIGAITLLAIIIVLPLEGLADIVKAFRTPKCHCSNYKKIESEKE